MDFNSIIAQLFKRFQTLSPKVWAIIVFLLGLIKYGLESGYAQGLFAWVGEAGTQTVLGWVTWFLTAVVGYSFAASSKTSD
jgi:hypothetical protein